MAVSDFEVGSREGMNSFGWKKTLLAPWKMCAQTSGQCPLHIGAQLHLDFLAKAVPWTLCSASDPHSWELRFTGHDQCT